MTAPESLELTVDLADPTPPYEQLRRQLVVLITSGRLTADDRLPPLRQLARDLGLAVGTVGRAYSELESEGLLTSRRGAGTRVAHLHPPPSISASSVELRRTAEAYAASALGIGADRTDALAAVERAWALGKTEPSEPPTTPDARPAR